MQLDLIQNEEVETKQQNNSEYPACQKTCRLWELLLGDFDCRDVCKGKFEDKFNGGSKNEQR